MKTFLIKDPSLIATWKEVLVDDEDFEKVIKYKWYLGGKNRDTVGFYKGREWLNLARFILNVIDSQKQVDHKDRNKLNNQKENLRICDNQQNCQNRGLRVDSSTGYKGVSLKKQTGRYVAYITVTYKVKHLGYFDTAIKAARAYDKAALEYYGEFASLNFPKSET